MFDLFRRIHPREGFHIRFWGPSLSRKVDRLVDADLIDWGTSSNYSGRSKATPGFIAQDVQRHMGIRLYLTTKGQQVRRKLKK